jgi:predicted Ser/Thr protein kinase
MHGSICVILKKFVDQNFGNPTWCEILRLAGQEKLVLSPIQSYPDDVVLNIVGTTCEVLELDLDTALIEVGKFAAPELIRFAKGMLHPEWKSFEVLANVESLIHRTIRVTNPGAEPASIQAFELSENQMQVIYSSQRGLCSLAQGILEGLGGVYEEEISVTKDTCCKKGDPFCAYTLTRVVAETDSDEEVDTPVVHASGVNLSDTSNPDPQSDPFAVTTMLGSADSNSDSRESRHLEFSGPASDSEPQQGQTGSVLPLPERMGRYSIHEILGYGGMGVVYRGVDETLQRVVAIKTVKSLKISSHKQEQFFAEARRLARLDHPNVVRIYDVGKVGKRPYFVMEYLEGSTLSSRLSKGPVHLKNAARIFRQLIDGLHSIHRMGMIHRDIKPGNIILTKDARKCSLLDFGLADDEQASQSSGGSRSVSGTQGYLPPERLKGLPGDYRGDYFSLGCVVYELFSGRMLGQLSQFQDKKELSLREIEETEQWLKTPATIRDLVVQMIAQDPEQRLCDFDTISGRLDLCWSELVL